ncbi:hypothetical protein [Thiolapillus brandeum]|uniref:GAF domain-containing protein n=1 Tax=Thiolapillus brandeum TaxID=1076588 RepID=A0A7U6JIR9_9GAMM|nr:hypothetical protein [Thiolapillus brandeum]BAO45098.1 hypothetical protein TBH_C2187 [Thiolapillus brandeum]
MGFNKQPVDHFVDVMDSWRLGVLGFFTRYTGLSVSGVLFTGLSMGSPWWWPETIEKKYEIDVQWAAGITIFTIGCLVFLAFYYLRKRSIRSLKIKYYLHQLPHDIRERQSELHNKLAPGKKYSKGKLRKELEILLKEVCENIACQFRLLTGDETISTAIRLAVYDDKCDEIVYKTFARTKGLNDKRKKTSEMISTKEGIARFLREEKKAQGVLIYNDLKSAAEVGAYKITENDRKYPNEIKTMMVAPLNAWAGKQEDMIGILYVTSRKNDVFSPIHVDQLAAAADLTAISVASSMELVRLKCLGNKSTKGENYAKNI